MDSDVQMSETPPAATTGEQILKDFQVLIEKVGGKPEVLLVGESQEGKDTRALMTAFVQELFPDACKPGISPAIAVTQTQSEAKPDANNSRSQLIFFLCRASSLQGKQAEILKILKEVKKFSRRAPAALVGVIVQPKKEEETEARKLMESVLQDAFPRQPHKRDKRGRKRGQALKLEEVQVEVEVEVFIPGWPRGKLAIMKAACRASEALQQHTSADVERDGMDGSGWGEKPGSTWGQWMEEYYIVCKWGDIGWQDEEAGHSGLQVTTILLLLVIIF
ncbi:uncharacterized protein C2orf72-like [Dermochelys coriacea]|uniref:uncharacterized protein C2orf72-like n=1 Tax=Dermochelys coriacea TaxID=27794 RepID=UPI001CA7E95C|nr:uncharacterized protein C2orf72-like [Dermochelys coriacea]